MHYQSMLIHQQWLKKNDVVAVNPGEDALSDSESELSELEIENQELNVINDDTLVKFQKKKQRAIAPTAQKMSVVDIPAEAKKIILLLKQTKDLVKYVKQVSVWSYSWMYFFCCSVFHLPFL